MAIQSIRRTPAPGRPPPVSHSEYREVWPEQRLNMHEAAGKMTGIAGAIQLAVVDSGIPDDDIRGPVDAPNRDDEGHATLLARTIRGAARTRSPGLTINIHSIKAFGAQGWPDPENCAPAINLEAANPRPRVIVLAWDVGHTIAALETAIDAVKNTTVVVIAAGNWSLDNDRHSNWPANYGTKSHVITVMASNEHDERASYSSYGHESVYIAAPGMAKVDAVPSTSTLRNFGSLKGGYTEFRGTSAATAHVALLAALVAAQHPDWTPSKIKARIGAKARPVNALTRYCVTGGVANFADTLD